ncbi:MAG: hypothetical protein MUD01_01570 [Chloroflexaceae bacterium]|nr:hypothetical protein [Chloroflexaceae bacterium]
MRRIRLRLLVLYRRAMTLLRLPRRGWWGMAAGLLACTCLLLLFHTSQLAASSYELRDLQRQRTMLEREYRLGQLQLAEAQRISALRDAATAAGLRPATPEQRQFIRVEPVMR